MQRIRNTRKVIHHDEQVKVKTCLSYLANSWRKPGEWVWLRVTLRRVLDEMCTTAVARHWFDSYFVHLYQAFVPFLLG